MSHTGQTTRRLGPTVKTNGPEVRKSQKLTPLQRRMAEERDMSAFDPTPGNRRRGNLLVVAQFSLLGLCLVPLGPALSMPVPMVALGFACVLVGLAVGGAGIVGLGSSTRIHPMPTAGTSLRTSGIYAWIRHPMYAAVMLVAIGATLAGGRLLAATATVALAVVLVVKARFEEHLLTEQFGWEYSAYAARVPAVIPRFRNRW